MQLGISATGGGAEKVASILDDEFHKLDVETKWLVLEETESYSTESLGIDSKLPLSIICGVGRLHMRIRSYRPNVILVHCEFPELILAITPFSRKIKIYVVEHQPFIWTGLKAIVVRITRFILRQRGAEFVRLRPSRKHVLDKRPIYIPNPVAPPNFQNVGRRKFREHGVNFVFAGRLSYDKGYDIFLDSIYRAGISEVNVFGNGKLKFFEQRYPALHVTYHGYLENFWEKLDDNCLLVITSRWEGDGLIILEAILAQIPILVIRFDDIEHLPIPPGAICDSQEVLISRLKELNATPTPDLSNLVSVHSREEILVNRSPRKIAEEYLKLFGLNRAV